MQSNERGVDWTVNQDWDAYTAQDHAVWRALFERQTRLLPQLACNAFVLGMQQLPMAADQIPNFEKLSDALERQTGWRVVAVPGLLPDSVFFDHLAHRRFPAGRFIRQAQELDYLQEPDIFHDVFGHVPMLMHPVMADFMQLYGQAGLAAHKIDKLAELARVYWYTVEFGLVREGGKALIYGAGIASSFTESVFAVQSSSPNRIAFDLERVMRTAYRIDDFQESYFVLESLESLLELAEIEFGPYYARVEHGPNFQAGELLEQDRVLNRGTGSYHQGRFRGNA
jgi:phenylalanine-4-hydroxylase